MTNTPPEVMEKWRKEFESQISKAPHMYLNRYETNGEYHSQKVQALFEGFIMARQTAVIELPEPLDFDDGHDEPSRHYWPTQIKRALRDQGYRVEVKS